MTKENKKLVAVGILNSVTVVGVFMILTTLIPAIGLAMPVEMLVYAVMTVLAYAGIIKINK